MINEPFLSAYYFCDTQHIYNILGFETKTYICTSIKLNKKIMRIHISLGDIVLKIIL
jgi:hypothetical protein